MFNLTGNETYNEAKEKIDFVLKEKVYKHFDRLGNETYDQTALRIVNQYDNAEPVHEYVAARILDNAAKALSQYKKEV